MAITGRAVPGEINEPSRTFLTEKTDEWMSPASQVELFT
jgi:hypothetical protein